VPVSIILGRNDPNLDSDVAQHISGLFKNPELHLLEQASHWPQWDRPDAVADLIKNQSPRRNDVTASKSEVGDLDGQRHTLY
jgi:haloalkane dehalogenase